MQFLSVLKCRGYMPKTVFNLLLYNLNGPFILSKQALGQPPTTRALLVPSFHSISVFYSHHGGKHLIISVLAQVRHYDDCFPATLNTHNNTIPLISWLALGQKKYYPNFGLWLGVMTLVSLLFRHSQCLPYTKILVKPLCQRWVKDTSCKVSLKC